MRILLHGPAWWCKSAYALQLNMLMGWLKSQGHTLGEAAVFGWNGRVLELDNVVMYPPLRDFYMNDIIESHVKHFRADYVLSLIDTHSMDPEIWGPHFKWLAWVTVDSNPVDPQTLKGLTHAHRVIAYSQFSQRMLIEAGLADTRYIPLAYQASDYYPGDQAEARTILGLPNDRFIVAMVQANRMDNGRKNFFGQFQAFAQFKRHHPDTFLYLSTCRDGWRGGPKLDPILQALGLREGADYQFADQYHDLIIGVGAETLRQVYTACDCLLQGTLAESFGVPVLEALACGRRVIATDGTAMPELLAKGSGYLAEADGVWSGLAWWRQPRMGALVDGLEWAYQSVQSSGPDFQPALERACNYEFAYIAEHYWEPFMQELTQ